MLINSYLHALRLTKGNYPKLIQHFSSASILLIAIAMLNAAVPYLLRETTNAITAQQKNISLIYLIASAYGLCWTLAKMMEWIKNILSAAVLARCDAGFHKAMFTHFIHMPVASINKLDPGIFIADMARSCGSFSAITFSIFWAMFPIFIELICVFVILATLMSLGAATIFLLLLLAILSLAFFLARKSRESHELVMKASNDLSSHLSEKIHFFEDIKANNAYEKEDAIVNARLQNYVQKVTRGNKQIGLLMVCQSLGIGAVLVMFTLYTVQQNLIGNFSIGDFVMMTGYIAQLTLPMAYLSSSFINIRKDFVQLEAALAYLKLPQEARQTGTHHPAGNLNRQNSANLYDLKGVSVELDGNKILNDLSVSIKNNMLNVIRGPSGIGKSTLIRTLIGFIQPSQGDIFFRGILLNKLAKNQIFSEISVVLQNPMILSGTLRENLMYGSERLIGDDELMHIANLVELSDLSRAWDIKVLDMDLGIQGKSLSGGEKQRIAIGRALARKTKVLLMDEPTSAIDSERAARIIERIRGLIKTMVVVTHRHELVEIAENIVDLGSMSSLENSLNMRPQ